MGIRFVYTLLLTFLSAHLRSQNLIPNPSFEANYGIPNCMDRFDLVRDWYNASLNTPDYLHYYSPQDGDPSVCDGNDVSSVYTGDNWLGNQVPHTGKAYAAIHLYVSYTDAREYIGVELLQPLCVGQKYVFESYVSACEISTYYSNMSFLLSEGKIFESFEIEREPSFSIPYPVQETNGWVQFKYTFVADKPYKYLTIGNFYSYSDDRFQLDGPYVIQEKNLSSYYIDDVALTPIEGDKPNLGNDKQVCSGNTIRLDANVDAPTYLWSTGDTTKSLNVSTSGKYSVCAKYCHSFICDTVYIEELLAPDIELGHDTFLCSDTIDISLQVDSSYTVQWNNGSTEHSLRVADYGEYWVNATSANGCISSDTFKVLSSCPACLSNAKVYPNPAIGSSTIVFTSDKKYQGVLQLYSNIGQLVSEIELEINTGVNSANLGFDKLMSGMYQVRIITSCGRIVLPVVVLSD